MFDVTLMLHLQDPQADYLKCYEVELFNQAKQKNLPETGTVVPESFWQAEEDHFCMVPKDSFPLIPISPNRVSRLTINLTSSVRHPKRLLPLLGDIPVSKATRFYAHSKQDNGELSLELKPEDPKKLEIVYSLGGQNHFPTSRRVLGILHRLTEIEETII